MRILQGLVLGPLLGGAIANDGSWRWVFLIKYVNQNIPVVQANSGNSVPAGAVGWLLLFFTLPAHFPNAAPLASEQSTPVPVLTKIKTAIHQVDVFGAFLLLTACSFIIAALQEGNFQSSWGSGLVISFLVIFGVSLLAFVGWEWFIYRRNLKISPMFPWRLTHNRLFMGVALFVFLFQKNGILYID